EQLAAKLAILLHDIGHGPYSHALEQTLIEDVHHEKISLLIMQHLNKELNGGLELAIKIFTDQYHKPFLHQLISGQLDVDRLDYLTRDSFFTGVSEGVIGYDRILKMLTTHEGELVVEEKALYSIEKFLVSRRLMYWQVYLHKTVLSAEMMLVKIIERARELISAGDKMNTAAPGLYFFLHAKERNETFIKNHLDQFCMLDDYDVLTTIKNWTTHPDTVLSFLCKGIVNRRLLKVKFDTESFPENLLSEKRKEAAKKLGITELESKYIVFTGEAINTTYNPAEERINILFKDQTIKDISKVNNALIQQNLSHPVKKNYICYLA
ncbi:MAG: HD domain-containing protein, partial [Gemmatimonadaceae bacterium]|nr:HD domain-containing protein [Chitinophagaceae bacterium]